MKCINDFNFGEISWLKITGIVKKFYFVDEMIEIEEILNNNKDQKIVIIGNASNIILSNNYFDGIMIKLSNKFNKIKIIDSNRIECSASVLSSELSNFAMQNELSNLEFLSTIPGTLGGNIFMNAGCYGNEIKDFLESIDVLNLKTKKFYKINKNEINFEYRKSNLDSNLLILNSIFNVIKKDKIDIKNKMLEMKKTRNESQPIGVKTCGSTFKNTKIYKAWELLDSVGLRGFRIGDAIFSEKHPNFMINLNNAKSEDFIELINLAKKKVYEKYKIQLELEIVIL